MKIILMSASFAVETEAICFIRDCPRSSHVFLVSAASAVYSGSPTVLVSAAAGNLRIAVGLGGSLAIPIANDLFMRNRKVWQTGLQGLELPFRPA